VRITFLVFINEFWKSSHALAPASHLSSGRHGPLRLSPEFATADTSMKVCYACYTEVPRTRTVGEDMGWFESWGLSSLKDGMVTL
jgi:hypothetical protein